MKRAKLISIVVCLTMFTALFTGCNQSQQQQPNNNDNQQQNNTQLDYPKKAVELIVPFNSGGSHDLLARTMSTFAEKHLGKPLTVTNKGGSSGALGSDYVASAKPDGYTLLLGGSGPNVSLHWAEDLPYGRQDSFEPICLINSSPSVIVVKADSPYQSIDDLVKAGKENPDTITYSSSGVYGACHIPVEMLAGVADTSWVHVPFDGGGPALTAVLGGQVDFGCTLTTQCISLYEAGEVNILATTGEERFPGLPDVPTLKELGYDASYVMGRFVLAPKGTDPAICDFLENAFQQLCEDSEFVETVNGMGEEITFLGSDEFSKWWDEQYSSQEEAITKIAAGIQKN